MSKTKQDHDNVILGVNGIVDPSNKWLRTMRFPTIEQRGYRLGDRNPDSLPGGPDRETTHENTRRTSFWRGSKSPLVFAQQVGGKYI